MVSIVFIMVITIYFTMLITSLKEPTTFQYIIQRTLKTTKKIPHKGIIMIFQTYIKLLVIKC